MSDDSTDREQDRESTARTESRTARTGGGWHGQRAGRHGQGEDGTDRERMARTGRGRHGQGEDGTDREQDGTDRGRMARTGEDGTDRERTARTGEDGTDRERMARTGRGRHGQRAGRHGQGEDGTDRERTARTGRGRHGQGEDGTDRERIARTGRGRHGQREDGTDKEQDRERTARTESRTWRGRHGQRAGQGEDGTDRERTARTGRGRHGAANSSGTGRGAELLQAVCGVFTLKDLDPLLVVRSNPIRASIILPQFNFQVLLGAFHYRANLGDWKWAKNPRRFPLMQLQAAIAARGDKGDNVSFLSQGRSCKPSFPWVLFSKHENCGQ